MLPPNDLYNTGQPQSRPLGHFYSTVPQLSADSVFITSDHPSLIQGAGITRRDHDLLEGARMGRERVASQMRTRV
jgi:hypothetical protein